MASLARTGSGRLAPVNRQRLADLAYAAIRDSILSGDFAMGERLVESQLASDLAMSRAPLREALRRLASQGLVEERPHQGTFVTILTAKAVSDMYNVRLGLETTAVRLFMKRRAPTTPLWTVIERINNAAEHDDPSGVVSAELDFHRGVVLGAENGVLSSLFADLEGRVMLAMALDDASFEDLHEVANEHVPVVEVIESGDQEQAVAVVEDHLLSTVGEALKRLGGDPAALLSALRFQTRPVTPTHPVASRWPSPN